MYTCTTLTIIEWKDFKDFNDDTDVGTHWAHDVVATLIQRRNNVVCPVGSAKDKNKDK